jgi:cystinosin
LAQLFLDAFVSADFSGIVGNPAKFGLSLLAMGFDVLFMVQHYVLYRYTSTDVTSESERQPILQPTEPDSQTADPDS